MHGSHNRPSSQYDHGLRQNHGRYFSELVGWVHTRIALRAAFQTRLVFYEEWNGAESLDAPSLFRLFIQFLVICQFYCEQKVYPGKFENCWMFCYSKMFEKCSNRDRLTWPHFIFSYGLNLMIFNQLFSYSSRSNESNFVF